VNHSDVAMLSFYLQYLVDSLVPEPTPRPISAVSVFSDSIYKYLPGVVNGVQFNLHFRRGSDIAGVQWLMRANHLEDITEDIRELDHTLSQHQELVRETREVYPGVPVVVSAILPRCDW